MTIFVSVEKKKRQGILFEKKKKRKTSEIF